LFRVKGSRKTLAINPEEALKIAHDLHSFYTNRDRQLVAVIPRSACYGVDV